VNLNETGCGGYGPDSNGAAWRPVVRCYEEGREHSYTSTVENCWRSCVRCLDSNEAAVPKGSEEEPCYRVTRHRTAQLTDR
jgi:hypothetical protein